MKSIHRQCVCTPVIPGPPPDSWIQPRGFLSVNCSSFVPRSPLCSQPHRGDLARAGRPGLRPLCQLWKDGRTDTPPPPLTTGAAAAAARQVAAKGWERRRPRPPWALGVWVGTGGPKTPREGLAWACPQLVFLT